jgi:hypothetical protein
MRGHKYCLIFLMKIRTIKLKSLIYPIILLILLLLLSCNKSEKVTHERLNYNDQAAFDPQKDAKIQKYNLEIRKKQTKERFPCDTISVMEYVFNNYPAGTYLLEFDRTTTYNIPKPAIIYYQEKNLKYVFAVIAASRPGERLIEPTNIIGYNQSLIDLDSTKLGTPFIYLVLFECKGNDLSKIWEAPVPSHGGFNNFILSTWEYKRTQFVKVNFHYAQGVGHINYNYFLVDGIRKFPHLLMTYEGTQFKRTLANINNDAFPDYYEHIFYNLKDKVYSKDSVAFIWNIKDSVYVNTLNPKQTRPY